MEQKMTILLVEDDETLADEIYDFLKKWGYEAVKANHFYDILKDVSDCRAHMILMDVNLPYYDGFYWCRRIRESSDIPILFISSRNDDRDKIMAIAQGADDYVEKPFHLELLQAKIDAVLRRAYHYRVKERIYLTDDLCFEPGVFSLFYKNKEIGLTGSEKKITAKLLEQRPSVVTREELMMELWGMDEFVTDQALTTLISRLRNKLKDCCKDELIKTKKGAGYFIS